MTDDNATKRGGPRPGAGRKVGYRSPEPTTVVRLPVDLAEHARRMATARAGSNSGVGAFMRGEVRTSATSPLVTAMVACGFPSPAEDHLEQALDLNELHGVGQPGLIFIRVTGESMTGRGYFPNDIAVVNRSLEPRNGCIVVACLNGEFTLKTFRKQGEKVTLKAENPAFPDIVVPEQAEFFIWGVVTGCTRVER